MSSLIVLVIDWKVFLMYINFFKWYSETVFVSSLQGNKWIDLHLHCVCVVLLRDTLFHFSNGLVVFRSGHTHDLGTLKTEIYFNPVLMSQLHGSFISFLVYEAMRNMFLIYETMASGFMVGS